MRAAEHLYACCPVQFRFMLLALASLEAPLQLPLGDKGLYGEDCVFIANDWHAALVPVYLAAKYRAHGVYKNARAIMAIHNLRHQVGLACCMYGSVCVWGGGMRSMYAVTLCGKHQSDVQVVPCYRLCGLRMFTQVSPSNCCGRTALCCALGKAV
jgi:hypothetical protein